MATEATKKALPETTTVVGEAQDSSTAIKTTAPAINPTIKKKPPRRKPGARECMNISKRFGVHVIPEKYMEILIDYSTRGKVEHLIKMRERLDCHSRFLEYQLAGLESKVKAVGESNVKVPVALPQSHKQQQSQQRYSPVNNSSGTTSVSNKKVALSGPSTTATKTTPDLVASERVGPTTISSNTGTTSIPANNTNNDKKKNLQITKPTTPTGAKKDPPKVPLSPSRHSQRQLERTQQQIKNRAKVKEESGNKN